MRRFAVPALLLVAMASPALAWGGRGHRIVHGIAAKALRTEGAERSAAAGRIADLVGANPEFFRTEADLPDRDRSVDRDEAPNHFLDLEAFGTLSFLRDIPATRPAAVSDSAGRLPWILADAALELRRALGDGRAGEALLLSARIGHYVADAHVPLHSTVDYDGRNEAERGIHGRWESRTVESMEELDALAPLPRAGLPHLPPQRPLSDSELVRWVQVLSAKTLAASHRLLVGVYGADEDARAADPTLGDTYLAVMRRQEGRVIRTRLGLAGRALAEVLLAAADDPETDTLSRASAGEMRLDWRDLETGPAGVVFRFEILRLGPPADEEPAHRIVLLAPRATRIRTENITPPDAAGDTREVRILLPWSSLRRAEEITARLEPLDRLSPSDNVERIRKKEWAGRRAP